MQPQTPQQPQAPVPTPPSPPQTQPEIIPIQPSTAPQPPSFNSTAPAKKRIPTWLKIVGSLVVLFIIGIVAAVLIAFGATQEPQKISDQFVNAVQAGDTTAAYALTSDAFKQTITEDGLNDIVQRISPFLEGDENVTAREIRSSTGASTQAVLVYTVKTSDGEAYLRVVLEKVNDDWQILNFRSSETPLSTDASED